MRSSRRSTNHSKRLALGGGGGGAGEAPTQKKILVGGGARPEKRGGLKKETGGARGGGLRMRTWSGSNALSGLNSLMEMGRRTAERRSAARSPEPPEPDVSLGCVRPSVLSRAEYL